MEAWEHKDGGKEGLEGEGLERGREEERRQYVMVGGKDGRKNVMEGGREGLEGEELEGGKRKGGRKRRDNGMEERKDGWEGGREGGREGRENVMEERKVKVMKMKESKEWN